MHTTPNYGFDKALHLCAMDDIDRELKRLEDKIGCPRHPGCAAPSHCAPADLQALRDLLDQKVDKQEGCRLVCEDELAELWRYIKDRYTKEEIDRFLEDIRADLVGKAEMGYKKYTLELLQDFEGTGFYCVNDSGLVVVSFSLTRAAGFTTTQNRFGRFPEEYRPASTQVLGTAAVTKIGADFASEEACKIFIEGPEFGEDINGSLRMHLQKPKEAAKVEGTFTFYAGA